MSKWRAKAVELFPEIRTPIQTSATPGKLWIELAARLHAHYSEEPVPLTEGSSDFPNKVYLYALWCHKAADWHAKEAAGIEFFESIIPFAIRSGKSIYATVVQDLVAYIGEPTIKNNAASFGYSLSPEQLEHFLNEVDQAAKRRARRSAKIKP
jgi:hypothetical protein